MVSPKSKSYLRDITLGTASHRRGQPSSVPASQPRLLDPRHYPAFSFDRTEPDDLPGLHRGSIGQTRRDKQFLFWPNIREFKIGPLAVCAVQLPEHQAKRLVRELFQTLKPRGVLFSSNPRGNNEEGFTDDRYACFFDLDTWRDYVTSAGFEEVGHYYRPPGLPRHKQPWLATVWRKA
jgi:hypothetical protein